MTLVHLMSGKHPFAGQRSYWSLRETIKTVSIDNIVPVTRWE